jgi:hypothetical protein
LAFRAAVPRPHRPNCNEGSSDAVLLLYMVHFARCADDGRSPARYALLYNVIRPWSRTGAHERVDAAGMLEASRISDSDHGQMAFGPRA